MSQGRSHWITTLLLQISLFRGALKPFWQRAFNVNWSLPLQQCVSTVFSTVLLPGSKLFFLFVLYVKSNDGIFEVSQDGYTEDLCKQLCRLHSPQRLHHRCTEARLCWLFNSRCKSSCNTLLSSTTSFTAALVSTPFRGWQCSWDSPGEAQKEIKGCLLLELWISIVSEFIL